MKAFIDTLMHKYPASIRPGYYANLLAVLKKAYQEGVKEGVKTGRGADEPTIADRLWEKWKLENGL